MVTMTEVEENSIIPFELVPKKRGMPKGTTKLTPEERKRRACEAANIYFYDKSEYRCLQNKIISHV